MDSGEDPAEAGGFPIRISADQSSFAAPRGFSQRTTSFIACAYLGIHRTPLWHLITLISQWPPARPGARPPAARSSRRSRRAVLDHSRKTSVTRETARRPVGAPNASSLHLVAKPRPGRSPAANRRLVGQALAHSALSRPLAPPGAPWRRVAARRAATRRMVEPDGIEPTTSCLQSRRSPN